MANSLSRIRSDRLGRTHEARSALAELVGKGRSPSEIAKAVFPDDPVKQKSMRSKVRRLVRTDQHFQQMVAQVAQGELVQGLGPATAALRRRAGRGNPTSIRLLLEATGFYNPRVKHEHSGDIKITLDLPRPPAVDGKAEEIQDAEVVD